MSKTLNCGKNKIIKTELPAFIMGILNATPDSFWEGSRAKGLEAGVQKALKLIEQGADIIDIGGESTRPGSAYVSEEEELERVIPLISEIRKHSDIPISVDTRKANVMRAAFNAGADICNDISALQDDAEMAKLIAKENACVILMHMKGSPQTMQDKPFYENAVKEVSAMLLERAKYAESQGIKKELIILDPGIGFGKRTCDNYSIIANLKTFADSGYTILMGLSRKTLIGDVTGKAIPERLAGTLAANMYSVMQGAEIVRVHDVAETKDVLSVLGELNKYGNT